MITIRFVLARSVEEGPVHCLTFTSSKICGRHDLINVPLHIGCISQDLVQRFDT